MASRGGAGREPDEYGTWDTTPLQVPPRSRLHHLAPVGVGTGEVESLASYFTRLAGSHAVSLHTLAGRVVAPEIGLDRVWWTGTKINVFFRTTGNAIVGMGETAEDWSTALATLTRRDDLRALTLLPWAGVLSIQGLLRATAAWCPACYQAWSDAGQTVYRPLLWHLRAITACPRHRRALLDRCPWPGCGRPQILRSTTMRPGYCTACHAWLGSAEPPTADETPDAATLAWQGWAVDAVGGLLADGATRRVPLGPEAVVAAVVAAVAHLGGNSTLARATGLPVMRITAWRLGRQRPTLPLLLRLCAGLGTTPVRLLTERSPVFSVVAPGTPDTPGTPDPPAPPRQVRKNRLDREHIRAVLAAQVREPADPPVSLGELARRLGCAYNALTTYAPDDAHIIVARWLAHRERSGREASERRRVEVRRVTLERHDAGLDTSWGAVKAALPDPAMWWTPDAEAARVAALAERAGAATGQPTPDQQAALPPWGAVPTGPRRPGTKATPPLLVTAEEREALTAASAAAGESRRARQFRAILLLGQGEAAVAVAAAVGVSHNSVLGWARTWRARGLAELTDPARSGPLPLLDDVAVRLIRELLAAGPRASGLRVANWTIPLLRGAVLEAGYAASRETVRTVARRAGWRAAPPEPDPDRPPLVALTDEERAAVETALAVEGRETRRLRLRAVLLLAQGQSADAVAAAVGANRASIYNWAWAWRDHGLRGLDDRPGAPGVPLLDAGAERVLRECLTNAPAAYGHDGPRWTIPLLRAELSAAGYAAGEETVRRMALRLGWDGRRRGDGREPRPPSP